MPPTNGIIHAAGSPGNREYLVLEEVKAKVMIIDVAARVTLIQKYRNPLNTATSRAVYYFPVPASGAVCAFEMKTSDDRVVIAVCKEKEKAREEYEKALSQGQETSLLEWVADDVFTISVGSIPANSTVSTKLVYTMTLPNDDNADEIRLQLPCCVGERYGPPLTALDGAAAPSSSTPIRITIDIQTSGRIKSITSPSHADNVSETRYPTHLGRPSRRRSTVQFQSSTFLDRDFILVIRADGLDESRCFAELHRDPEGIRSDTVAMQFTIVPNFQLPPVKGQEYIFLVDRSGSMSGARIETAKRTLELLLRMLPYAETKFNIFSFGTHNDSLWTASQTYNQNSVTTATAHVTSMSADYGGTEIRGALNAVFKSRNIAAPTAVFVLTDGEVTNIDHTTSDISTAVRNSHARGPHCRLRVFCLGIGDGVSSAMCEGIARAGEGECIFAVHTESILLKCVRLFRAGRTPFVEGVSIDWGIPDENFSVRSQSVNFSTPSNPRTVRLQPAPAIQQSPADVSNIHASTRMNIYAILTLRKTTVPKEVTLRGHLEGGGPSFELTVPIRSIQLTDSEPGLPMVHSLAAWRLIQDHQEETASLALAVGDASEDEIRKASIVRLGERYQVASRHTSFVAVDSGSDARRRRARRTDSPTRARPDSPSPVSPLQGLLNLGDRLLSSLFNSSSTTTPPEPGPHLPGAWRNSGDFSVVEDRDEDEGYNSAATFSTLSSLEGSYDSDWSDGSIDPPPVSEEDARMQRSPSPKLEPLRLAPSTIREERRRRIQQAPPQPRAPPPPVHPEVVRLAAMQLFDGSFDDSIRGVIGDVILNEADVLQVDRAMWATAVSIAFTSKHLADPAQKDLLDDLLQKAYDFLGGKHDAVAKRLIQMAKELV
ncbi:von Willebrand factor type A domain-containing protein [Mycena albidolilacea]|uniref:von Willebrand factor type A domain-containing protein n=1 Tax=Mycena albidolilacea TaxID=1033008 RepID=A0AAD7EZ15_9AGAR|nr:von Willebrand factor type A domain-containing protein [Mycena albidolilacea]